MPWLLVTTIILWLFCLAALLSAWRTSGLVRRLKQLLAAALWALLGTLLGGLLLVLQAFQAFSGETLVARVTAKRLAPDRFILTYAPTALPAADSRLRTVHLRGDQWSISGGIIKWHPWLTAMGISSYHKPLRLSGQFSDVNRQQSQPPTVYALAPSLDGMWEAFYWMDRALPFVEAVYGSAAYAYVEPGVTQEIYVTPSGYMIKRR